MGILNNIWNDIKQGENIDLYITVGLAIVLAVLSILGFASQTWIAPLSIAIWALLAFGTLGNRHRLDNIINKLNDTSDENFLEKFPPEFEIDLNNSTELWIIGVHLSALIKYKYDILKKKLENGSFIKVLLVNPHGISASIAASRNPGRKDDERERTLIKSTLIDLSELKKLFPDNIEIRTIDYPLSFCAYVINPENLNGRIYLKRYGFKTGIRPKFIYQPKDRNWYNFIKSEIYTLWEHSEDWDSNND